MATCVVSPSFDAANPSPSDLRAIRVEQIARINLGAREAMIAPRPEEVGMSHQLSTISTFLAAHGFTDAPCDGEVWFGSDIDWFAPLAPYNTAAAVDRALFGGRHPLFAREPMKVAA